MDFDKLRDIVATTLRIDPSAVTAETSMQTVDAWDSLAHLHLVLAIEKAFGVKFATADIPGLQSVGAIQAALERSNAKAA